MFCQQKPYHKARLDNVTSASHRGGGRVQVKQSEWCFEDDPQAASSRQHQGMCSNVNSQALSPWGQAQRSMF